MMINHKHKNMMMSGVFSAQSVLGGKPKNIVRSRVVKREEVKPKSMLPNENRYKENR